MTEEVKEHSFNFLTIICRILLEFIKKEPLSEKNEKGRGVKERKFKEECTEPLI
jgi:hypothetical protein